MKSQSYIKCAAKFFRLVHVDLRSYYPVIYLQAIQHSLFKQQTSVKETCKHCYSVFDKVYMN